jgi:hypothetical protein
VPAKGTFFYSPSTLKTMILAKDRTPEYEQMVSTVAQYLENKGFEGIRAQAIDTYEDPAELTRKDSQFSFTPDLTASINGSKHYFEIVDYPQKDQELIVSKWMLLSTLASHRDGHFSLIVPFGKMNFTKRILKDYKIQADVIPAQTI